MASASTDAAEIRRRGRQRLIGAVAIVLLLVVFVPMLLDSEPRKPAAEAPLDIPSKENAPPLPPPVPASETKPAAVQPAAPATASTESAASTASTPAGASPASEPAPAAGVKNTKEQVAAVAPVTPAKAGAPLPTQNRPPASAGVATSPRLEGFAVQVGAFRDEAKLEHARDKLTAAGIPHYTERLDTASGGPLTRLRAGPFPTRQAADGAAAKLKAAQLPGRVVPLP